ncbi:hypothetical protein B4U79_19003, partial [Dinothrombium tinctorium]
MQTNAITASAQPTQQQQLNTSKEIRFDDLNLPGSNRNAAIHQVIYTNTSSIRLLNATTSHERDSGVECLSVVLLHLVGLSCWVRVFRFNLKMPRSRREHNQSNVISNEGSDVALFHGLQSECVRDFVDALELYKSTTGLNDENIAKRVPRFLRDIALNWYTFSVQKNPLLATNWRLLKSELVKAFSPDDFTYKMNIDAKLRKRTQSENEPFRSYFYDIMKLCARLNPSMTEEEKKGRLLNGIKPLLYQQIAANMPKTCDDILQKVQSIESINDIVTERRKNENGFEIYNNPQIFKEIEAYFANRCEQNCEKSDKIETQQSALPNYSKNAYAPKGEREQMLSSRNECSYESLNSFPTTAVIDTGAGVSVVSEKFLKLLKIPRKNKSTLKLRSVNNELCETYGIANFDIKIGNDVILNEKMILDFSDKNNLKIKFADSDAIVNAFTSNACV